MKADEGKNSAILRGLDRLIMGVSNVVVGGRGRYW